MGGITTQILIFFVTVISTLHHTWSGQSWYCFEEPTQKEMLFCVVDSLEQRGQSEGFSSVVSVRHRGEKNRFKN